MIKALLAGGAAAALLTSSGAAAAARPEAPAWVVTPAAETCRTEIELTGASGSTVPVTLASDGDTVELVFQKADAPERAFLPIRIDHKPFPNLVLRERDGKTAVMALSAETLAAARKGAALQIGWLADEPLQVSLAGSEQGLADLRACGAQVAARFREQQQAARDARARAEADARAKALADEQFAAVKAQRAAAEAEAQRNAAEAERLRASAEAERQRAQAEAEAARERAAEQAEIDTYPPAGGYYRDRRGYYPQDPYPSYAPPYAYRRW